MSDDPTTRMLASLDGLSVGDAFGELFFDPGIARTCLPDRTLPPGTWRWTDDTNMALSIVEVLAAEGTIDQDRLALSFGTHFDGTRGYGTAMYGLLAKYELGVSWRDEAPRLFGGQGSYGNGASMRVAPLGAFFAGDLDRVVVEARRAAEITHAHPEGIAGAIAVAAAAALATGKKPKTLVERVIDVTPDSEVRDRLERAKRVEGNWHLSDVVALLGHGSRITAQDTVAFAIWVASYHLKDYEDALWLTVAAGGDIDTNCAIVGGIVGARVGRKGIPKEWLNRRERLPEWHHR